MRAEEQIHLWSIRNLASFVVCLLTMLNVMVVGCVQTPSEGGVLKNEQNTLTRYRYARVIMGSRCEITLEAENEPAAARAAGKAFGQIQRIERVLSDYDPRTESMLLMQREPNTPHPISATLLEVLLLSMDIHKASAGSFDPTVGAITHLWRAAARAGTIPTTNELDRARTRVGIEHLQVNALARTVRFDQPGMILDFGGIGKGYAARMGVELLRELGYPIACVDMGGDLQFGDPPSDQPAGWRVEVMTGLNSSRTLTLHNCAIATSGDLERYYEHNGVRYSHIIDPRSGLGVTQRRAATVIATDAAVADALASAISVLGEAGRAQLKQAFPQANITLVNRPLEDAPSAGAASSSDP